MRVLEPLSKLRAAQSASKLTARPAGDDAAWRVEYRRQLDEHSGPIDETDDAYANQHVFTGEYSYFGKLVTERLTKIVNLAAFKNTGNGVSMATKNLGYGAICNTGRLHQPLFFKVCTEVLAAPWVRDKLVLNVIDGIRGQYDGGPMPNEQFWYANNALYLATDPFALDRVGQDQMVAKRKAMGVKVNEHPRFTDYLDYAQKLAPERVRQLVIVIGFAMSAYFFVR